MSEESEDLSSGLIGFVFLVFFILLAFYNVNLMMENKTLHDKLQSPEYENCQLALLQCNTVNETKENCNDK